MRQHAAWVVVVLASTAGGIAAFESERGVLFLPGDFRSSMLHYASVDRADGKTYRLYVGRETFNDWRSERLLGEGAIFAIESFSATEAEDGTPARDEFGRLIAGESDNDVHIMVKSTFWPDDGTLTTLGLLFGAETGPAAWRMAGFDPRDQTATEGLDIAECHECHTDPRAEDFLLSRGLLDRFVRSGTPSFIAFSCPEREICFGTSREIDQ